MNYPWIWTPITVAHYCLCVACLFLENSYANPGYWLLSIFCSCCIRTLGVLLQKRKFAMCVMLKHVGAFSCCASTCISNSVYMCTKSSDMDVYFQGQNWSFVLSFTYCVSISNLVCAITVIQCLDICIYFQEKYPLFSLIFAISFFIYWLLVSCLA
jgi:hypothetical protein